MKPGRLLLLGITLLGSLAAQAHTRSESYSTWHINDLQVTTTISIPGREITRLTNPGDYSRSLSAIFEQQLQQNTSVVDVDGTACSRVASQQIAAAAGFLQVQLDFSCAKSPSTIHYRTLFDAAPSHVHYARVFRDGKLQTESLFTVATTSLRIDIETDRATRYAFIEFFSLGVDHIISGIDHIAFLFGLLLVAGAMRRSLIAVTGFTIGHSVSLGAAVLGYVSAQSVLVEAFIGFTVALVAVEYFLLRRKEVALLAGSLAIGAWLVGLGAWWAGSLSAHGLLAYFGFGLFAYCYLSAAALSNKSNNRNAGLILLTATFCFGLVHGFGFAGFLIATGLLGGEIVKPLLGFNLGVEAGQLMMIALALTALWLTRRWIPSIAPQLLAAALCGIGVFWFVGRSFA